MTTTRTTMGFFIATTMSLSGSIALAQPVSPDAEVRVRADEPAAARPSAMGADRRASIPAATAYKTGLTHVMWMASIFTIAPAAPGGGTTASEYKTGHAAGATDIRTAPTSFTPAQARTPYVATKPWLPR